MRVRDLCKNATLALILNSNGYFCYSSIDHISCAHFYTFTALLSNYIYDCMTASRYNRHSVIIEGEPLLNHVQLFFKNNSARAHWAAYRAEAAPGVCPPDFNLMCTTFYSWLDQSFVIDLFHHAQTDRESLVIYSKNDRRLTENEVARLNQCLNSALNNEQSGLLNYGPSYQKILNIISTISQFSHSIIIGGYLRACITEAIKQPGNDCQQAARSSSTFQIEADLDIQTTATQDNIIMAFTNFFVCASIEQLCHCIKIKHNGYLGFFLPPSAVDTSQNRDIGCLDIFDANRLGFDDYYSKEPTIGSGFSIPFLSIDNKKCSLFFFGRQYINHLHKKKMKICQKPSDLFRSLCERPSTLIRIIYFYIFKGFRFSNEDKPIMIPVLSLAIRKMINSLTPQDEKEFQENILKKKEEYLISGEVSTAKNILDALDKYTRKKMDNNDAMTRLLNFIKKIILKISHNTFPDLDRHNIHHLVRLSDFIRDIFINMKGNESCHTKCIPLNTATRSCRFCRTYNKIKLFDPPFDNLPLPCHKENNILLNLNRIFQMPR